MTRSSDAPEWLKELPALISSQGGVIFNNKHIEYWKERAHEAERKLRERDATISRQREALERISNYKIVRGESYGALVTVQAIADEALTPTPPEHSSS
jgi:hypothetical protein